MTQTPLTNATIKRLKAIGHRLNPIVIIGNNGMTPTLLEEVERALTDHELIKVKLPAGSKEQREEMATDLAKAVEAHVVQSIGRMALLFRQNPNANPKLSNLIRYGE